MASTSQESTLAVGRSLASSLYHRSATIWLSAELGAGKTTFVQGLGLGLGLGDRITSPTYALENRYGDTLLHMDLFRLDAAEARRVVEEAEEFPGIRTIECGADVPAAVGPRIEVRFEERSKTERRIAITFNDIRWPGRETIERWRDEVRLPDHIARHCDAIGDRANAYAEELLRRGTVVRPRATKAAGELHDLFRFVDFRPGGTHMPPIDERNFKHWGKLAGRRRGGHEDACADFVAEHGFPELAQIIRPHGLHSLDEEGTMRTTEQKLLFYSDKRVRFDTVVTLDERFDDFAKRYGNGVESARARRWREKTKALERELFGEEIP